MIEIKVCTEGSCSLKGAYGVYRELARITQEQGLENEVDLSPSNCLKDCNKGGVCVAVGEERYSVQKETVEQFVNAIIKPLAERFT
ncbi:MAG: (2Fe-2S) ferredoxin domain-containing protein [Oscillospiraceae bacterium]